MAQKQDGFMAAMERTNAERQARMQKQEEDLASGVVREMSYGELLDTVSKRSDVMINLMQDRLIEIEVSDSYKDKEKDKRDYLVLLNSGVYTCPC